jgi:iron complex transport system ATP-binding protein
VVEAALASTGAAGLADRRVTELSGGERARVALARVLAVQAPVILADEPTAALDPRYQLGVMNVLAACADRGGLILAVTHDLGLAARFAHSVLVMNEGRIVAAGSPEQALSADVLRDIFKIDAFRAERDGQAVLVPWTAAEGGRRQQL